MSGRIYPNRTETDRQNVIEAGCVVGETWTETVTEPGITRTRQVTAGPWKVERTDCFCCSCGEEGGSDPHCRNHGWVGERPCETHNMPGTLDDEGKMPASVQKVRRDHAAEMRW